MQGNCEVCGMGRPADAAFGGACSRQCEAARHIKGGGRPPAYDEATLREALQRFIDGKPAMSIPARPDRDADLILAAAIDELVALRRERETCGLALRPEVLAFAEAMEAKLRKFDSSRGDEWRGFPVGTLIRRTYEEAGEMARAAYFGRPPDVILNEAADVGNFAMMVAWVAREEAGK